MILTCPVCATQYGIPDGAIGEKGRKVKCVQCAHVWRQMPVDETEDATSSPKNTSPSADSVTTEANNNDAATDSTAASPKPKLPNIEETTADNPPQAEKSTRPAPANAHKPMVPPPIKTSAAIKASFAIFALLALLLGTIKFHLLGDLIGQADYNGMMITDFSATKSGGEPGIDTTFDLSITVKNNSNIEHPLPPVHITFLSAGGNVMETRTLPENDYETSVKKLASGDSYIYEYTLNKVSGNVKKINFDIGNSWELAFR